MSETSNLSAPMVAAQGTRRGIAFPVVLGLLAVTGALVPGHIGSALLLTLLTQATIGAVLATSVGFLIRQNGLVSFGHAAFFGGGAYLVALAGQSGLISAEAAIIAAVLVPTVVAFAIAFVMLRVSGVAFSMLTLAVAEALHELMMRWRDLANGEDGLPVRLPGTLFGLPVSAFQTPGSMFVICWIVLMALLAGLWLLSRSHLGTLTLAIQDNEERARFIGYETLLPRAVVFALSAGMAAMGGVLFALYNGFVSPDVLHWSLSGEALVMAIIGGARTLWGPALGAVVFFFLRDAAGSYTEHWQALIGIVLITVTVALPTGLSGALGLLVHRIRGGRHG
jgi:branched-chain amino acid transport system permease protein